MTEKSEAMNFVSAVQVDRPEWDSAVTAVEARELAVAAVARQPVVAPEGKQLVAAVVAKQLVAAVVARAADPAIRFVDVTRRS